MFAGILVLFFSALFMVYVRWQQARVGSTLIIDEGAAGLGPAERLALQAYLLAQSGAIDQPVGTGEQPVTFTVSAGQNANQIAINLAAAGILDPRKEALFLNYLRYYGLDSQLEAGTFAIAPSVSIPELSQILIDARPAGTILRITEGWRSEQIAEYLAISSPAQVDSFEFLALVQRRQPIDLTPYSFLVGLDPGQSLEGYLFPDTYELPEDANAEYLLHLMLRTFGERVTPAMRQAFGARGLNIAQATALAAIVEREAVLPEEQPLIAGVFLNRLADGMKLDADPTVQYAVGYDAASNSWWKAPLTTADLQIDSPYNTYLYGGLTPTPIANPGLGALEAVAEPAVSNYYYFVANCDGLVPGAHLFSVTYEEHLLNVQGCR